MIGRLEAVSTLDLVLEVVDRASGHVHRVDQNPSGHGEVSAPIPRTGARPLCFVVSARRPKVGVGNDPDERYVLHVEAAPPTSPE